MGTRCLRRATPSSRCGRRRRGSCHDLALVVNIGASGLRIVAASKTGI